ncbi:MULTISPECIES: VOC family protein [unclassified Brevundimonas]|uniref:VOC family protein n=1 Tax=unclassified Brevundimonas TaxID=2622653 RepID=UPI0025C689CC|nr:MULTISPECIES: VOC family protein [unclassified Brevundimonas]
MKLNQVTVEVSDIPRAKAFYQALGLKMIVSSNHYARFICPGEDEDLCSTFSIHIADQVRPNMGGVYFECDDLDARVAALKAAGFVFDSGPVDQDWNWREAWLRDPDGNRICLYFAGVNRTNPPWRVAGS